MFYDNVFLPMNSMQTEIQWNISLELSDNQDSWICKFWLVHLGFVFARLRFYTVLKYDNWILNCDQCLLQVVFIQYFPKFYKNQYFLAHFHICVLILANRN